MHIAKSLLYFVVVAGDDDDDIRTDCSAASDPMLLSLTLARDRFL